MEEEYEETEYMKKGWDNNVENCNIDISRTVMICDNPFRPEYYTLEAGYLLGSMGIDLKDAGMYSCGKWHWITFSDEAMAVAFKILWDDK